MISHEVVTSITIPLPCVTYRFDTDGGAYADGKPHKYFSQPTPPRVGKDVGSIEWTDEELPIYQEAVMVCGVNWLIDALVKINAAPAITVVA
jgi:hypothetical protein